MTIPAPIIGILGAEIKDVAGLMIEQHGQDAEAEAEERAEACQSRGDRVGCEAWWRVAAAIREAMGATPTGPHH